VVTAAGGVAGVDDASGRVVGDSVAPGAATGAVRSGGADAGGGAGMVSGCAAAGVDAGASAGELSVDEDAGPRSPHTPTASTITAAAATTGIQIAPLDLRGALTGASCDIGTTRVGAVPVLANGGDETDGPWT
jgi:hypothetical protein